MNTVLDSVTPKVSVCCVTYNHKQYIADAIDGFIAQKTSFPYEIIIHDDASTDGTQEILLDYQSRYPSTIKLILQNENQYSKGLRPGPIVLKYAKGAYIAFCDGDDCWTDENKLQIQFDFLESNHGYSLTYHDARVVDCNGDVCGIQLKGMDSSSFQLLTGFKISTLTAFFRNNDLYKNMPRDLLLAPIGDYCLWAIAGLGGRGKYLKEIDPAIYRKHPGGILSLIPRRDKLINTAITYCNIAKFQFGQAKKLAVLVLVYKAVLRLIIFALIACYTYSYKSRHKETNIADGK